MTLYRSLTQQEDVPHARLSEFYRGVTTTTPTTLDRRQGANHPWRRHLEIQAAARLLEEVLAGLPEPPDIADRQEGRLPYDVATDALGTIECVLADNLWPAVAALQRSAHITDAELVEEYHELWERRLDV